MSESTPVLTSLSRSARQLFIARATTLVVAQDGTCHVAVANLRQVSRIAVEVYLNADGDPERLMYELDGCQAPTLRRWRNPDLMDRTAAHLVGRLRRERKLLLEDQRRTAHQLRRSEPKAA